MMNSSAEPVLKQAGQYNMGYILTISMISALGGLLFGFDISVISGAIPFLKQVFNLSGSSLGWAVSSALIGCIFGPFIAGTPSDKFGRRNMLVLCAIFLGVSAVGSGMANSLTSFFIYRFIGGLGVGMASTLSPVYIAEVSPADIRGKFVSLNQLTIVIGILIAYFTNYLLVGIGPNNWRWMFASEAFPAVIFLGALFFVPESPRWLYKKKRDDEAFDILTKIAGSDYAKKISGEIKKTMNNEEKGSFKELLHPSLRFVMIIGILLAILQQWCGINVIFFYAPVIFQKTGIGIDSSLFQTIIIGVVNLTFTLVAMRLIDKVGRKKLLLIGSAGMVITYILIGACFFFNFLHGIHVLVLILMTIAFYATSLAPVVWVLISEIYPNRIRGEAMSIATFFLWVASFVLTLTFPILEQHVGESYTFWLYAGICLLGWLFIFRFVPETKGKSLEELEEELIRS